MLPTTVFSNEQKKRTPPQVQLKKTYDAFARPNRVSEFNFEKGSFAYSMGNAAAKSMDFESAIKHWNLASKAGNFYADWQLARYYLGFLDNNYDSKKATKYLRLVVSKNKLNSNFSLNKRISANALVELAVFYRSGNKLAGIPKNVRQAIKLLKYAATSIGHPKANYLLGEILFNGENQKSQKKRAMQHYKLSAFKNYFLAQVKLGEIKYINGRNTREKLHGLAWLIVAKKDKPLVTQQKIDKLIRQGQQNAVNKKFMQAANNLARRISTKLRQVHPFEF
ncbi:MAG: sel1 repeat family protein [Rhizobiales bacterium]|nr:sel1 repeat family protein [Hyphomicrobiales bacterium]